MALEDALRERLGELLRPFASSWSGSLHQGDLVIPRQEIDRLIGAILSAVTDTLGDSGEVDDQALFQILTESHRLASVQDQMQLLRKRLSIRKRG